MRRYTPIGISATVALLLATSGCERAPEPATVLVDPTSERAISNGRALGSESEPGVHAWRGIPFAEAPVGELRWRAPRPPATWRGDREFLTHGPACVQIATPIMSTGDVEPGSVTGSEDCLTLSVYAPATAENAVPTGPDRRPVMVWIHGGANLIGQNGHYDWSRFVAENDVVVFAVNYRLGPFGWFPTPGPGRERRSPRRLGQLRHPRSGASPRVGARQRRRLRRGRGERHDLWRVGRGPERHQPAPRAPGRGPVPPRHRTERWHLVDPRIRRRELDRRRRARPHLQLTRNSREVARRRRNRRRSRRGEGPRAGPVIDGDGPLPPRCQHRGRHGAP